MCNFETRDDLFASYLDSYVNYACEIEHACDCNRDEACGNKRTTRKKLKMPL